MSALLDAGPNSPWRSPCANHLAIPETSLIPVDQPVAFEEWQVEINVQCGGPYT